jgi:hypothetical protein
VGLASRKGDSFIGFFLFSLFLWPVLVNLARDARTVPVAR